MRWAAMLRFPTLCLAALLSLPLAAPAMAATPNVGVAFGNTVLIVDPDGRSRKIWLQPGGAWTGLSRRGLALAGKWTVKGDKVCISQSKPRLPGSVCNPMPTRLGASVRARDPSGKPITLKLVKGRVRK